MNPELPVWRGRLAVRIAADEQNGAARSVSAGFELTGNTKEGGLTLFTPIGGTAAVLAWSKNDASLTSPSDQRHFPSLEALINHIVGTPIPVESLFAWLNGTAASADGWTADLSGHANGRITAQRTTPGPSAELRVVLDK
ncbi:lipoprotein insertase outer membrane protein LolB [Rhodoferax sp. PAMC 29310]|uniref:lipoprotein insertase outer membrane protein LolB n=1 Tax=Rhodoferax sp. PAMC 29310 TaxID=2822760 RepID=UPI001B33C884|nr:lipoprotein insertase outer membrane protein LolB [Rhodoferax sp. PAMC 29310]